MGAKTEYEKARDVWRGARKASNYDIPETERLAAFNQLRGITPAGRQGATPGHEKVLSAKAMRKLNTQARADWPVVGGIFNAYFTFKGAVMTPINVYAGIKHAYARGVADAEAQQRDDAEQRRPRKMREEKAERQQSRGKERVPERAAQTQRPARQMPRTMDPTAEIIADGRNALPTNMAQRDPAAARSAIAESAPFTGAPAPTLPMDGARHEYAATRLLEMASGGKAPSQPEAHPKVDVVTVLNRALGHGHTRDRFCKALRGGAARELVARGVSPAQLRNMANTVVEGYRRAVSDESRDHPDEVGADVNESVTGAVAEFEQQRKVEKAAGIDTGMDRGMGRDTLMKAMPGGGGDAGGSAGAGGSAN